MTHHKLNSHDLQCLTSCSNLVSFPKLYVLKPEQIEVVEWFSAGHDVLSNLPTGFGKSSIYQAISQWKFHSSFLLFSRLFLLYAANGLAIKIMGAKMHSTCQIIYNVGKVSRFTTKEFKIRPILPSVSGY